MIDLSAGIGLVGWQFVLYAAGWLVGVVLLRDERRSALAWLAFNLCMGTGLLLAATRGEAREFLPYTGSALLFVSGFALAWLGLRAFLRVPLQRPSLWLLLLATAAVLLLLGPAPEHAAWRVVVSYGSTSVLVALAVGELWRALRAEFGRRTLLILLLSALLVALGVGVQALRQLLQMDQVLEMQRGTAANTALLLVYLAGGASFNVGFLALVVLRLLGRLQALSLTDVLTGLANRRAFEQQMAREWQRHLRHGTPMAVLMIDLDHFKAINDRHGHATGDAVLTAAARRLREGLREIDVLARVGGEEFAALLPDVRLAQALVLAERLRAELAASPLVNMASVPVGLTGSFGVADATGATTWRELLARADRAVYQAKASGRDTVCAAFADTAQPGPPAADNPT